MADVHPSIQSLANHITEFSNDRLESADGGGDLPNDQSILDLATEMTDLIVRYFEGAEAAVALRKLLECLDAVGRASDRMLP